MKTLSQEQILINNINRLISKLRKRYIISEGAYLAFPQTGAGGGQRFVEIRDSKALTNHSVKVRINYKDIRELRSSPFLNVVFALFDLYARILNSSRSLGLDIKEVEWKGTSQDEEFLKEVLFARFREGRTENLYFGKYTRTQYRISQENEYPNYKDARRLLMDIYGIGIVEGEKIAAFYAKRYMKQMKGV